MTTVNLEDNEWNYVLSVLGDKPWREVNMVLMKMGSQLQQARQQHAAPGIGIEPNTRASPPRVEAEVSSANSGHSPEQREEGPRQREEGRPSRPR